MSQHLLLIDASGFAHRSFWSGPQIYRSSDGMPTWAILGFMGLIWRLLGAAEADRPTHAAAVFDHPGKTFRHDLFPAYKANRTRSDELTVQMPYMARAAAALGLLPVTKEGVEGDDVLATLASEAVLEGCRVTVVTSDKDMLQIVQDESVEVIDPVSRQRYRKADVLAKFGVKPGHIPDLLALAGDTVDNVPGLPGVGLKAASSLIREHGGVGAILLAAKRGKLKCSAGVKVAIRRGGADLKLYRKLTALRYVQDLPGMADLAVQPIQRSNVQALLKDLGASARFEVIFATDPMLRRPVERHNDPFGWWQEELKAPGQHVPETPQCGFYERRLVKGAVFVPCRIFREIEVDPVTSEPTGREVLLCEVAGLARDARSEWGRLCMRPITAADYNFRIADTKWAKTHARSDPAANPGKPVNLLEVPAPRSPKHPRKTKR